MTRVFDDDDADSGAGVVGDAVKTTVEGSVGLVKKAAETEVSIESICILEGGVDHCQCRLCKRLPTPPRRLQARCGLCAADPPRLC
jgi:hypothetical protein